MKKLIILCLFLLIAIFTYAQKLQLTEAATEYKNNFSPAWMMQPDQLEKNKTVLMKAKIAIDASFEKQKETPFTKPKDEAKMYYYRGMIYLDYSIMGGMDVEIMSDLKSMDEKALKEASLGSLKKCMELDTRGDWKELVEGKINMLRSMSINGGVQLFEQEKFADAHLAFAGAVEFYKIIGIPDTLAMLNAALAAERNKDFVNAFKFYRMCADNNYGEGAEMYQSMIRVLNADTINSEEQVLGIIFEGKAKFPADFILNVEEFNYWYSKGDNDKAQSALQKAVEADPENKILHFNIGVTYDNMSVKSHEAANHEVAFIFMDKSIEAYKKAIEIDGEYVDAYFNLGALYYNQSIEVKSVAGDLEGKEYDIEIARADQMMKDAIPYLARSHELNPKDISTLKVLKSIYFTLDIMEKYTEFNDKLKALGY